MCRVTNQRVRSSDIGSEINVLLNNVVQGCPVVQEGQHPIVLLLIGAIYSLPRYIASSPQGVCVGLKPEMHLKENTKLPILVAPETQVDARNRPEDQLLARQHT